MSPDIPLLIHRYLDNELTNEELEILGRLIQSDENAAREFAAAVMLHDRLRNEYLQIQQNENQALLPTGSFTSRWARPLFALLSTAGMLLLAGFLVWQMVGVHSVSAAAELDRIIALSSVQIDRTFAIALEEIALPDKRRRLNPSDSGRPPKPGIDGGWLFLRGENQFVLKRKMKDDQFFVTGCNGKTSWAVRPDGPVRVSSDITRFARDLPGHEHAMPLNNLHGGLEQINKAYDVSLMPAEVSDVGNSPDLDSSRLLVAVKKRGYRGPKRVEISYAVTTGQIHQIRFVEMPYGPEKLTLRMTLVEEQALGESFYDHEAHHDSNRVVEFED